MKATGIVRRIDDLGRVVIPKEIRRTQLIRVGDPLEIFVTAEGDVVFRKYSPMGELAAMAARYAAALHRSAGVSAVITDRDRIVAASGDVRAAQGRAVSADLARVMETRRPFTAVSDAEAPILCEEFPAPCRAVAPILCHGDLIGCVALTQSADAASVSLITVAAAFFAAQLEE